METLRGRLSTQRIDQDRGVQEERDSAHPVRVGPALCPHPGRRIVIPLVPLCRDRPECGQDLVPAALVVQSAPKELRDEAAPPSLPDPLVKFGHELILEAYVYTHVRSLTHKRVELVVRRVRPAGPP